MTRKKNKKFALDKELDKLKKDLSKIEKSDEAKKYILTGNRNWKEFRDWIIKKLKETSNEKEFCMFIEAIVLSTSKSEEEMQRKRRTLNIPET